MDDVIDIGCSLEEFFQQRIFFNGVGVIIYYFHFFKCITRGTMYLHPGLVSISTGDGYSSISPSSTAFRGIL